jgi:hypothetical protein
MSKCVDAVAYLLADDTKLYKEIKRDEDSEKLQKDLDSLQKWSDTWLLKFHLETILQLRILGMVLPVLEIDT